MFKKLFDALGASQPEPPRRVSIEQLSHELALRFASKCYTHLEITHFKDNFKSLADHQDGVEYWKEDTLARFLCLPEPLRASSVIFQMCTYLGAFPFPSLAPCILTREAMIKVLTIMTGRYRKVLKRGNRDKARLLFRSLAVFDRRASVASPAEKPDMKAITDEQKPDDMLQQEAAAKGVQPHLTGFAIDQPSNDNDEDEDDDDLALAALDSLDAIEVFKQDQVRTIDRKMNHALIPTDNFRRLLMLLLLFGGIRAQHNLSEYAKGLDDGKVKALEDAANAIIAAFDPDPEFKGIRYSNFVKILSTTMPDLFEPLNALFEHFMFSKNFDLSKHKGDVSKPSAAASAASRRKRSPIQTPVDESSSSLLNDTVLSQLSMSVHLGPQSGSPTNIYTSRARFHQIFSTSSQGTSLSSFSRQVMSWQSPTLILVSGSTTTPSPFSSSSSSSSSSQPQQVLYGAFLPHQWRDSSNTHSPPTLTTAERSSSTNSNAPTATLFSLLPRHAIFPSNPSSSRTLPPSYFSSRTGIALGCIIPAQPRTGNPIPPIAGPASLAIDTDLASAVFTHDLDAGTSGAFVPDPGYVEAQSRDPKRWPIKVDVDIDVIEVWGITFSSRGGGEAGEGEMDDNNNEDDDDNDDDDEVQKQRKRLEWEEREAERRRGLNFGGDKDGARHLLEMAGIVGGDHRSGGSMG